MQSTYSVRSFHVGAWLAELSEVCPHILAAWREAREEYLRVRSSQPGSKRLHAAWAAMSLEHKRLAYTWRSMRDVGMLAAA